MENQREYKGIGAKYLMPASGLFIVLASAIILAGWFWHGQSLAEHVFWSFPTPFNTAFVFLLCGVCLIALYFEAFVLVSLLGLFIAALAMLVASKELLHWDLGGDEFFLTSLLPFASAMSEKMALNTAVCFVLSGIFFWRAKSFQQGKKTFLLLGISSSIIAFALLVMSGYISGMQSVYFWNEHPGMTPASAIGFILIGINGVYYAIDSGKRSLHLICFPICVCILTLAFGFALALWEEQREAVKTSEITAGKHVKANILKDLQSSRHFLEHLARVRELSNLSPNSRSLWEEETRLLLSQEPGLIKVLWVNANGKSMWEVGDSRSLKSEAQLNDKTMEKAKAAHKHTAGGIYDESGWLTGMSLYIPIFSADSFEGYMVGIFDIKKFLQGALTQNLPVLEYKVSLIHGGNKIISSEGDYAQSAIRTRIPLNLFGLHIDISIEALEGILGRSSLILPLAIIFLGGAWAFLVAVSFYYAFRVKKYAEKCEKVLMQLRRAHGIIIEQERLVSLGTLTAGIVHEVKNPLNIVGCFSELSQTLVEEESQVIDKYASQFKAEDKEALSDILGTLRVNLVRIGEQSKRANNTIQRMLAHSKGHQEAVLTDVHGLIDEYLNLSYYSMHAQDPSFNVKISKRYDVSAPKIYIVAEDMSRVFLNLFNNAYYALAQRKKKEGSGFVPELIVTTSALNEHFEIRIRDNGLGISETVKNKIFTPFFTTKPLGSGTGLGLSLSRSIVGEHGGVLDFISKESEFTEFHISLPITPGEQFKPDSRPYIPLENSRT